MKNHSGKPAKGRVLRMAVVAVVLYGAVFGAIYLIGRQFEQQESTETLGDLTGRFAASLTMEYQGRVYAYRDRQIKNILIIGVDREELAERPTGLRAGGQADFLLLLTIDKTQKKISFLQIDRDTMTPIQIYGIFGDPAGERTAQVCLAQAFGQTLAQGSENTVKAVGTLLCGIQIDHYFTLDMAGISKLNDVLGGVTITLRDDFSDLDPEMQLGRTLTLNGRQAEIYVRGRMGVSDGTNESRMERQRAYMNALSPLLSARIEENLNFVNDMFDALEGHFETSMSKGLLINEINAAAKYPRGNIQTIAGRHAVSEEGFAEFYADDDALKALIINGFFSEQTNEN